MIHDMPEYKQRRIENARQRIEDMRHRADDQDFKIAVLEFELLLLQYRYDELLSSIVSMRAFLPPSPVYIQAPKA